MTKIKVDTLDDLFALRDEYQKQVQQKGEELLKKEFKGFFEATPEIESVRWAQYVPGFNDGDPCTFTMGELTYRTVKEAKIQNEELEPDADDDIEYEYDEGYNSCWWYQDDDGKKSGLTKETKDKLKKFAKLIDDSDSILELIFGENVQITASKDKIESSDYDCGY